MDADARLCFSFIQVTLYLTQHLLQPHPDDPEKSQQVFFKQNFSQDHTYSFHVHSQASVGSYRQVDWTQTEI